MHEIVPLLWVIIVPMVFYIAAVAIKTFVLGGARR